MPDSLRLWILWQVSLTAFLVAMIVILRMYAASAFFSYWMKAWTLFGISLACGWLVLDRSVSTDPVKWLLLGLSLVVTFLQAYCLFLGTLSLRRSRKPGPGLRQWWLLGAFVLAALVWLVAFLTRANPQVSFAVRSAARCSALAAAYLYSAYGVARYMHYSTSRGARLVTWACLAYALVETAEVLNALSIGIALRLGAVLRNLFLLDGGCEALMTASIVLLLVERSRQFNQRLELYESILPTCAVCGAVRDDARKGRGKGGWMPLEEFVRKYSSARFSHGVCPKCMETQMEYARRARQDIAS